MSCERNEAMNADYRNWVPRGLIVTLTALTVLSVFFFLLSLSWTAPLMLTICLFVLFVVSALYLAWSVNAYRAFSYDGTKRITGRIISGIADYIKITNGSSVLDVGCGSGALAIAVAKRNPGSFVTGLDRWGKEYASFSMDLCRRNAVAEEVSNVSFVQGDARRLPFPDESFDAVTSNYVYHNIPQKDRHALLLETLRVLKKGGVFAIHDIMTESKYGDISAFAGRLRDMGYSEVRVIDTTDGVFLGKKEAMVLMLSGSKLLYGRK